ncbi:MAG: hypothetical protein NXI04_11530 [Planctomycetaceae bacterium]|nr:hypothetical protein [Planctomycetaceae bacterium]
MSTYEAFVGIDYSGSKTPTSRSAAIQVYRGSGGRSPRIVRPSVSGTRQHRNWCRRDVADWLIRTIRQQRIVAGIDHGFSFPVTYFRKYGLTSWRSFLDDFCHHWPTDRDDATVDSIRKAYAGPPDRMGGSREYRLAEQWTSSAKSVFLFDVQGSVAKSTFAGLPWLKQIRDEVGDLVHFWPFDGWQPVAGKSVLAEVYPSIFRRRYPPRDRSVDQQDAFGVASWLADCAQRNTLDRYFDVPLKDSERTQADLEGWILGVT